MSQDAQMDDELTAAEIEEIVYNKFPAVIQRGKELLGKVSELEGKLEEERQKVQQERRSKRFSNLFAFVGVLLGGGALAYSVFSGQNDLDGNPRPEPAPVVINVTEEKVVLSEEMKKTYQFNSQFERWVLFKKLKGETTNPPTGKKLLNRTPNIKWEDMQKAKDVKGRFERSAKEEYVTPCKITADEDVAWGVRFCKDYAIKEGVEYVVDTTLNGQTSLDMFANRNPNLVYLVKKTKRKADKAYLLQHNGAAMQIKGYKEDGSVALGNQYTFARQDTLQFFSAKNEEDIKKIAGKYKAKKSGGRRSPNKAVQTPPKREEVTPTKDTPPPPKQTAENTPVLNVAYHKKSDYKGTTFGINGDKEWACFGKKRPPGYEEYENSNCFVIENKMITPRASVEKAGNLTANQYLARKYDLSIKRFQPGQGDLGHICEAAPGQTPSKVYMKTSPNPSIFTPTRQYAFRGEWVDLSVQPVEGKCDPLGTRAKKEAAARKAKENQGPVQTPGLTGE